MMVLEQEDRAVATLVDSMVAGQKQREGDSEVEGDMDDGTRAEAEVDEVEDSTLAAESVDIVAIARRVEDAWVAVVRLMQLIAFAAAAGLKMAQC